MYSPTPNFVTVTVILFIPLLITEADVTYNMLQHLYGGKARQLDKMRRTKPGRYEHPINFERRIINSTYRGLERYDNKMVENLGLGKDVVSRKNKSTSLQYSRS